MLIIAERINSSRKSIARAIEDHDIAFIQNEAKNQADAGGDYIDVNAGTFLEKEADHLKWIINAIQQVTDRPLSIDSPNPQVIKDVLPFLDKPPIINSVTAEPYRLDSMLPLVIEKKCKLIGLCQSGTKLAESVEEKVEIGAELVEKVTAAGVLLDNLYIDPLIYPISANQESALNSISAIKEIMKNHPGVHTTCGLTNVSYGLPGRKLINRTFLVAAIAYGLDSAIIDPTDNKLVSSLMAALAVTGRDNYCLEYLKFFRSGRLE
jgi:5-methyltetrahydrofolate corrinoid/iron sulfur protein methyltransferase